MLVRHPGSSTSFARWDGRDLEELAAEGLLHTDSGFWPAATTWRIAGTFQSGSIPETYADIGVGFTAARVLPSAAGTIQVERASGSDDGLLLVEYLDADWYHRSAVYLLDSATVTLATGAGTGDTAGQAVTAWRVLTATYLDADINVGAIAVKIGATNVQTRIAAGHRISSLASSTVPRGQIFTHSSYQVAIDTTKVVSMQLRGGIINPTTGVSLVFVRKESAEQAVHDSGSYRPEPVQGRSTTGARQYAPIDIALFHKASQATTGAVDAVLRGVMHLDELHPDPQPELIPWVAAAVSDLTAAGLWPFSWF